MALVRLDKYISNNTEYSRSQIKELIKSNSITIDGVIAKKSDVKVDTDTNIIEVCGKSIVQFGLKYYMLNKPIDVVCSTQDDQSTTVIDLLPKELQDKGLFPAGRLDKDSQGFVLLTNDGQYSHKILSSKHHVAKYYLVRLSRPFESSYVQAFKDGIVLSNGEVCLPANVMQYSNCNTLAVVELYEGKYHQIKRMFASVGNHVEGLFRFQIGNLELLPTLPKGAFLEILHKDLKEILKNTDGIFFQEEFQAKFSSYVLNI